MSDDKAENLAISNIMRNEDGRGFIWSQLQACSVFESMFDNDPIQHAYNAGMREAGLRLDRLIKEAEPSYYVKMIEENIDG